MKRVPETKESWFKKAKVKWPADFTEKDIHRSTNEILRRAVDEAHEKHVEDVQEALDEEFGR